MENAQHSATIIREGADRLADAAMEWFTAKHTDLVKLYGPTAKEKCRADTLHHLRFLEEAVALDSPALFSAYVEWLDNLLIQYHVSHETVRDSIDAVGRAVSEALPADDRPRVEAMVAEALARIGAATIDERSFIDPLHPHGERAGRYLQQLLENRTQEAHRLVEEAIRGGTPVEVLYEEVIRVAMYEVGRLWYRREISVAREHFCTAATQYILSRLYAEAFAPGRGEPKVVVACAQGEQHELGARMVADLLSLRGFDTLYLGADTPVRETARLVAEEAAPVVCLSATLPTHATTIRDTVAALKALDDAPTVIVGGGLFAVDERLWRKMGADHYAATVDEAAALFERLGG